MVQRLKCLPARWETRVQSLGRVQSPEEGNEEGKNTTPVFLPGESHGQRSLVGYSPWGRKDSDTDRTERFHFHFHFLSRILRTIQVFQRLYQSHLWF